MLIIFDCDGVLVDSEQLAAEIFSNVLSTINIKMSPRDCFDTFHGRTLDACYVWLENHYSCRLPAGFGETVEEETQRRFTKELQPVAGIEEVLETLIRKKIKYCLASNGGHAKIENSLQATKLLRYFPHRFSAEDVNQGKPQPDLFLYAADKMQEAPSNSVVVEDSLSGYQAALAADMRIFMYTPHDNKSYAHARSFYSMKELISLLPL